MSIICMFYIDCHWRNKRKCIIFVVSCSDSAPCSSDNANKLGALTRGRLWLAPHCPVPRWYTARHMVRPGIGQTAIQIDIALLIHKSQFEICQFVVPPTEGAAKMFYIGAQLHTIRCSNTSKVSKAINMVRVSVRTDIICGFWTTCIHLSVVRVKWGVPRPLAYPQNTPGQSTSPNGRFNIPWRTYAQFIKLNGSLSTEYIVEAKSMLEGKYFRPWNMSKVYYIIL